MGYFPSGSEFLLAFEVSLLEGSVALVQSGEVILVWGLVSSRMLVLCMCSGVDGRDISSVKGD